MDYLTQYYKNHAIQLQEELNQLNENIFGDTSDNAYQLYQFLFNGAPGYFRNNHPFVYGNNSTKPGRHPTRTSYKRPIFGDGIGKRPMFPPGKDPNTLPNQWYPGPDVQGIPHGPAPKGGSPREILDYERDGPGYFLGPELKPYEWYN